MDPANLADQHHARRAAEIRQYSAVVRWMKVVLPIGALVLIGLIFVQGDDRGAVIDMQSAADAAILGGGVPTAAITQACSNRDILFVPFDATARDQLVKDYPFFAPMTVAAGKYPKQEADYPCLNVGSMQLISHANVDEETVYLFTKTLYEQRAEVVKQHPAGKAINAKNIVRDTGLTFHPGAVRYYKEIGIWPEATTPTS